MNEQTDRRPVVAGVDDSDSARLAAEWAADLAAVWRAPIQLVHVVPDDETGAGGGGRARHAWLTELWHAAERAGTDLARDLVSRAAAAATAVLGLVLGLLLTAWAVLAVALLAAVAGAVAAARQAVHALRD